MEKVAKTLAALNAGLALVVVAFSLTPAELAGGAPVWLAMKIIAAILIILVCVLTWLNGGQRLSRDLLLLGGLSLVALGAATGVWTIHLGLSTGDVEFYMLAYGGSLIAQGALISWSLVHTAAKFDRMIS
jgi:hypothetical protein